MYLTGAERERQRFSVLPVAAAISLYDWGALPRRTESGSSLDAEPLPSIRFYFSSGSYEPDRELVIGQFRHSRMKAALKPRPFSSETLKVFALLGVGNQSGWKLRTYARKPYLKGL
jgi:hypothetical protein